MKVVYKGYEIDVRRERCLGGWTMLYYDIFRVSDGWNVVSNFTTGSETAREYIKYMKERIDAELAEDDPWGEKLDDACYMGPSEGTTVLHSEGK